MFERFTDRARRVVVLAREEASRLGHNYIGTEHILLGLTREGHGVAAKALESLGVSLDDVREQVEQVIGHGDHEEVGHIPFTPEAKKLLELSLREAMDLGHNYIGTEHILLGLLRENDGVAAQVLTGMGVDLPRARQEVVRLLEEYKATHPVAPAGMRPAGGTSRLGEVVARLESIEARLDAIQVKLDAIQVKLGITPDEPESDSP